MVSSDRGAVIAVIEDLNERDDRVVSDGSEWRHFYTGVHGHSTIAKTTVSL